MTEHVDIAVIGGGIHGAGVAQAGAAAGYSVCVLEQFDELAHGTSGHSSKLIHGGLRYLETRQFGLVRECLVERALLLKNAPELVYLVPFYIPVYRHSRRSAKKIRAGLALYALLGGLKREYRFTTVARRNWMELDGLETQGLRAVFRYHDAQTDDAALTHAVMRSAVTLGTRLITGARVTRIKLGDQDTGIVYTIAGREDATSARIVINAAGPWVNHVLRSVAPAQSIPPISMVQGAHIIVPGPLTRGIYYAEARDGRPVFFMPWRGNTLVGTTETPYLGDPTEVSPLSAEIDYLLEALAATFPSRTMPRARIISSFAGLRVLPADETSLNARPRETHLVTDRALMPRLVSIYGGKLTVYRATAERVLNLIGTRLPPRKPEGDTRMIGLSDRA